MGRSRLLVACLIASMAVALSACSTEGLGLVDQGRDYTQETALRLAASADPQDLDEHVSSDSAPLRHDALVDLRRSGDAGAEAASLITKTFPSDSTGVPFYVERATFESAPALIVLEAIGRPGGTLTDTRVWVLSEDGDVLLSATR